jgi:hypothetical protein
MECECSLPSSKQPATCPHPKSYESSPYLHTVFALNFNIIIPSMLIRSSKCSLSFGFFDQSFVCISHVFRVYYMSHKKAHSLLKSVRASALEQWQCSNPVTSTGVEPVTSYPGSRFPWSFTVPPTLIRASILKLAACFQILTYPPFIATCPTHPGLCNLFCYQ